MKKISASLSVVVVVLVGIIIALSINLYKANQNNSNNTTPENTTVGVSTRMNRNEALKIVKSEEYINFQTKGNSKATLSLQVSVIEEDYVGESDMLGVMIQTGNTPETLKSFTKFSSNIKFSSKETENGLEAEVLETSYCMNKYQYDYDSETGIYKYTDLTQVMVNKINEGWSGADVIWSIQDDWDSNYESARRIDYDTPGTYDVEIGMNATKIYYREDIEDFDEAVVTISFVDNQITHINISINMSFEKDNKIETTTVVYNVEKFSGHIKELDNLDTSLYTYEP